MDIRGGNPYKKYKYWDLNVKEFEEEPWYIDKYNDLWAFSYANWHCDNIYDLPDDVYIASLESISKISEARRVNDITFEMGRAFIADLSWKTVFLSVVYPIWAVKVKLDQHKSEIKEFKILGIISEMITHR